jgi:hypothetical protein
MIPDAVRSTMLETHRNVFARDIRSHRNDWGRVDLPDKLGRTDHPDSAW